jgi:hypothetical protein
VKNATFCKHLVNAKNVFSKKGVIIMYMGIRQYKMDGPESVDELFRRVEEGFVPIISKAPGFISYSGLDAGDGLVASITVFEDQAGMEESNRMAADWVKENLVSLLPNPPEVTAGEIRFHKAK